MTDELADRRDWHDFRQKLAAQATDPESISAGRALAMVVAAGEQALAQGRAHLAQGELEAAARWLRYAAGCDAGDAILDLITTLDQLGDHDGATAWRAVAAWDDWPPLNPTPQTASSTRRTPASGTAYARGSSCTEPYNVIDSLNHCSPGLTANSGLYN